ncbi:DUF429 domain-containing protein [Halosimplex marinum]|uniref:DUF429 domain-containing protein n=1 Tax=Halosimplex marinum TaxID=3396620 RepID=UPI003F54DB0D
MALHVGVDWASGTWVVVTATADETTVDTEPSLLNVWHDYGDRADEIVVDIPVHLVDDGDRKCDQLAKEFLGLRASTVFWTPNEQAVATDEYPEAAAANSRGLGSQSWGLIPRIREVQALLTEIDDAQTTVYESHPEVCFRAFSEGGLPSKTSTEGISRRQQILQAHGGDAFSSVVEFVESRRESSEWHQRIQSGRLDDVLDAAVLALTAREANGMYSTFPAGADPATDPSIVIPGRQPVVREFQSDESLR